ADRMSPAFVSEVRGGILQNLPNRSTAESAADAQATLPAHVNPPSIFWCQAGMNGPDQAPPIVSMNSTSEVTAALKHQAQAAGFGLVGVAPAVRPEGFERLRDWLSRGFAGRMEYLEKRREAYEHPENVLP